MVHDGIVEVPAADWNRLAGDRYPFLKHEFLEAAEQSASVGSETGWRPRHLTVRSDDGALVAAMPLYQKSHSWGEFVFDWAWANAYERARLAYYPKLVSAVPFTPATCPKLLLADRADQDVAAVLLDTAVELSRELACSSVHILFPVDDELAAVRQSGFVLRRDCQFHWHNDAYCDFDAFLARFTAAKRKKARRDRRRVAEADIRFRHRRGSELDEGRWQTIYALISRTFTDRGSEPYFNCAFFQRLATTLPDDLLVVEAEYGGDVVAAAVFYVGADTLYGRYWGSHGHFDGLHFETCYYQGIEFCIRHGLRRFEPGTQGEHKISRGFLPETTWSGHWLADARFQSAIAKYIDVEADRVEQYMQVVRDHSPFRRTEGD
jgi:predicted N-acyltransferase